MKVYGDVSKQNQNMPPVFTDDDILANSLLDKVVTFDGCIGLLGFGGASLEVCYEVRLAVINVKVLLKTPIGDVELGSGTLTPDEAQIELGGGKGGFKAKVTITADFSALTLEICGEISIPFGGSKKGCTQVTL